jgi:hypothetical protein
VRSSWLIPTLLAACVSRGPFPGELPGGEPDSGEIVEDVRCAGTPVAERGAFRHFTSELIAALGDPRHRGFDLVASPQATTQVLEGWISYTLADKALEDEDVDVFACGAGQWQRVGTARTDDEGHFALALSGGDRLPLGMRDLFASVVGDRTGVRFLGYVAPEGSPVIVSDVDGTLTSSENAFLETIVLGSEPDARAGAAQAFTGAAGRGVPVVYVTARGNQYTTATRAWLRDKGFPRGPVRLSPSFITLPGGDTVEFKAQAFEALSAAGLALVAGVGNRASDVAAYTSAGLAADRIFIELPEFADEVLPLLDEGAATGFTSYGELAGVLATLP